MPEDDPLGADTKPTDDPREHAGHPAPPARPSIAPLTAMLLERNPDARASPCRDPQAKGLVDELDPAVSH